MSDPRSELLGIIHSVGKFVLVDYDTIELSNLNRQLLFTPQDIGKNKAEVAREKLKILNPDIEIIAFKEEMSRLPKSMLNEVTLIASCLDSFEGRRWANSLAIRENVPLISGGMYAFLGNVQRIIPMETACFECQPLISQEKLSQACSPLGDARKNQVKEKPKLPSVSTVSSVIAGLMSQEILKQILNIGNKLNNYLFYDGLSNSFTELELKKNSNCPMCGSKYQLEEQSLTVDQGENIKNIRYRIALAFGLAAPQLMYKGNFLNDEKSLNFDEGSKIYITDERLAKPIIVKIRSK